MKDILSEIVANKRFEVDMQKQAISIEALQEFLYKPLPCHSLRESLIDSKTGIIAEFKRRSPSKGWIHPKVDPKDVVPYYAMAGAAGLSILTDEKFFGGNLGDIKSIRKFVDTPILRKDFIVDEYQLYQSKLIGADIVLLIASILSKEQFMQMLNKAHELKLEVLLEVHDPSEIEYITPEVDVVGINNRHLGSFITDVQHSFEMAELLPQENVLISESGIKDTNTICQLRKAGYKGFLIGETLMSQEDPAEKLRDMIQEITKL